MRLGLRTLSLTAVLGAAAVPVWLSPGTAAVQQKPASAARPEWADWVEPGFPFFSSVLDARRAGDGFPTDNLTPRGLVLNLGGGRWAAFDVDLLRIAAVWSGNGVTPKALAPGSYHHPDKKTPGGQFPAPEPDGTVWLANGIYPGWQAGARPTFDDPREPAPSAEEVGRGPLPEQMGRFRAVRLVGNGAVLEYTVAGANVREWITSPHPDSVERHFEIGASDETMCLVAGIRGRDSRVSLTADGAVPSASVENVQVGASTATVVRIGPHQAAIRLSVGVHRTEAAPAVPLRSIPSAPAGVRWREEIATSVTPAKAKEAFVVDDIALPVKNPWRRAVRPGDVQFLGDGTGAMVTLDGDVWLVRGLHEASGRVRWRRFASGLHEPLTLAIRDDQIYVYDRNGIWRVRDTNGDGEADVHELFSNAFAQTADMREFPNTIRPAPGGEFVIAKGNQQATTIGKHNGTVLRISADGRTADVLGYGFRQPNIGVNIRTGLVTASDQQGHYIPTTPLHVVKDRQFYGFLADKQPREIYPAPIADPLTWIPHAANASAMSQVWLFGARMGPLNDQLVHIGYNNPEVFRVLLNDRCTKPQAAVVSITRGFEFPPLNGSVNPADGQLYLTGFQILGWGTTASRLAGMGRVRYTGAPSTVPRDLVPTDKGILLRFDVPLDRKKASDPDSYVLTSWKYQRSYRYGSPQFKEDGTPGMDRLVASSAYVSADGRAVFIGVPGMKPVMQMRLAWSLATDAGQSFQENAYFTPYELAPFEPGAEGFGDLTVDLKPRTITADTAAPVNAVEGRRLYQSFGCVACHSIESTSIDKLGPSFKGLFGRQRVFVEGTDPLTADEPYLRESILKPEAKIAPGYGRGGTGMPSYAGVLTDQQIDSLILFIKSLR